ncbi:hypothetical protein [Meiothermus cerbereus]|nr:hypothetical protein [Meiothermus cerbereus]
MRLDAILLGIFWFFGLTQAQGTVYKLRVTDPDPGAWAVAAKV